MKTEKEVRLPISIEELDIFVGAIEDEFQLPACDEVYEAIATAIMHLPAAVGHAKRSYFAGYGIQALSKIAAYSKLAGFDEKRKQVAEKAAEETQGPASGAEP